MNKDYIAQLTVRDLPNMTKHEVREITTWLDRKVKELKQLTAKGKPWLVTRRDYANIHRMGLLK
jgi:hypothetical protein